MLTELQKTILRWLRHLSDDKETIIMIMLFLREEEQLIMLGEYLMERMDNPPDIVEIFEKAAEICQKTDGQAESENGLQS